MFTRLLLWLALPFCWSACSKPEAQALPIDELGRHTFEIIAHANEMSDKDIQRQFISIRQAQSLARQYDSDALERIQQLTPARRAKRIGSAMEEIRHKSVEYGVLWDDARYMDFMYTDEERDGIPVAIGELFIKYQDEVYYIDVMAFKTKAGKYILGAVENFEPNYEE